MPLCVCCFFAHYTFRRSPPCQFDLLTPCYMLRRRRRAQSGGAARRSAESECRYDAFDSKKADAPTRLRQLRRCTRHHYVPALPSACERAYDREAGSRRLPRSAARLRVRATAASPTLTTIYSLDRRYASAPPLCLIARSSCEPTRRCARKCVAACKVYRKVERCEMLIVLCFTTLMIHDMPRYMLMRE